MLFFQKYYATKYIFFKNMILSHHNHVMAFIHSSSLNVSIMFAKLRLFMPYSIVSMYDVQHNILYTMIISVKIL